MPQIKKISLFILILLVIGGFQANAQNQLNEITIDQGGNENSAEANVLLGEENILDILQLGDQNDAEILFGYGEGEVFLSEAYISEVGNQNTSDISIISGEGNIIEVYQEGNRNAAGVIFGVPESSDNYSEDEILYSEAYITQIGHNNNALVEFLGYSTGNLAFTYQEGNQNQAKISGGLVGSNSEITQFGNLNYAEIFPNAYEGVFSIFQEGQSNTAMISSTIYGNEGFIYQYGRNNKAEIEQAILSVVSDASIIQTGNRNESIIRQRASIGEAYPDYNLLSIIQEGNQNVATGLQGQNGWSYYNTATISQYGNRNHARTEQGSDELAEESTATIVQNGNRNEAIILQGVEMDSDDTRVKFNTASIDQNGNANTASIIQNNVDNSTVVISQIGNGNTAMIE